jgi:hypothetical protein
MKWGGAPLKYIYLRGRDVFRACAPWSVFLRIRKKNSLEAHKFKITSIGHAVKKRNSNNPAA